MENSVCLIHKRRTFTLIVFPHVVIRCCWPPLDMPYINIDIFFTKHIKELRFVVLYLNVLRDH